MPQFITKELLANLTADVERFSHITQQFSAYDTAVITRQPAADKWSVAQVLAHLNSYNRYYLPHMEAAMKNRRMLGAPLTQFTSGWLGDYFTKSMYSSVPTRKEITNKMKAPKDHTPVAAQDADAVIAEFLAGQQKLLQLLNDARRLDIAKVKIPISIARWVKISLGDTFRFLLAHQERHFLQISNTLAVVAPGAAVAA